MPLWIRYMRLFTVPRTVGLFLAVQIGVCLFGQGTEYIQPDVTPAQTHVYVIYKVSRHTSEIDAGIESLEVTLKAGQGGFVLLGDADVGVVQDLLNGTAEVCFVRDTR